MEVKSKMTLVKEAQAEQQEVLNQKRIGLLESLQEFKGIGGEDDIKASILAITAYFKTPGIPMPLLYTLGPDLNVSKAVKELVDEKKILKTGKKGNYIIHLAEA